MQMIGNERDGAAPKCKCRVYAMLYLSKTSNNPNWLFFGYPFFKNERVKSGEDEEDVDEHFANLKLDNMLGDLEERVAAIKKKKSINMYLIVLGLIIVVLSICLGRV
ncbi:hypothetical protein PIB30_016291 [Stylosanthes scabra]|uniref:Uncharacterized protein n=1 Tax=Stylosanthes scabra TaxID=79078 RepID=A0ABU6Q755_9FABA|nr:hypothetical protein [Stylosanthes scabra]